MVLIALTINCEDIWHGANRRVHIKILQKIISSISITQAQNIDTHHTLDYL